MDPTRRFAEMVNGPESAVDLTEGWLVLGELARPGLDVAHQRSRLDELAAACGDATLEGVRRLLFDQSGFSGVRAGYYEPANSHLESVLDRRLGLPISLSTLMIEVGRRAGVPIDGVGMPGHFIVSDRLHPDVFVDPFDGGRVLDRAGCRSLFHRIAGPTVPFLESYLHPVPASTILARMAANLVNAYTRADDRNGMRWAARVRARCPGVAPQELVTLGAALARAGAYDEAASVLDEAARSHEGTEAAEIRQQAQRHRARLN